MKDYALILYGRGDERWIESAPSVSETDCDDKNELRHPEVDPEFRTRG
jgi:hypothetical protein